MYTFSSKLKTFSLVLMAVGLLGIGYGFYTAPKDIKEVEALLASESHGEHGVAKHEVEKSHDVVATNSETKTIPIGLPKTKPKIIPKE